MIVGGNTSITCLYDNITVEGTCPSDNPAVFFLTKALETVGDYVPNQTDLMYIFNGDTSARPEPQTQTPQLFRTFTYEWTLGGGQAPIAGTNASCPFSEPSNGTSGSPYTVAASPSLGAFLGVVTGLMVGFGVVYTIMLFFPGIEDRELTVPYVTRNTASKAGNEQLSSTDGSMIPSYSGQAERSKSIVGGEVVPVFFSLR